MEIRRNTDSSRFEITVDGTVVGVLEYQLDGAVAEMSHTVIEPRFGGRGLGGKLVRYALDHARAAGWQVIPTCSFVAAFIEKHPNYADLVKRP